MNFRLLPDDPKLTAYALGELTGDERAAVEAALRQNPGLRATVDEIRATAAHLEAALAEEPLTPPTPIRPVMPPAPNGVNGNNGHEFEPFSAKPPRRSRRRVAMGAGPESRANRREDPYSRSSAKLLRFPQFYYVVGGLAAACFAVFVALRSPKPEPVWRSMAETHREPSLVQPMVTAPSTADSRPENVAATGLLMVKQPETATSAAMAPAVADAIAPSASTSPTPASAAVTMTPPGAPAFVEHLSLIESSTRDEAQPTVGSSVVATAGGSALSADENTTSAGAATENAASLSGEFASQTAGAATTASAHRSPSMEPIVFNAPPAVDGSFAAVSNLRPFASGATSLIPGQSVNVGPGSGEIVTMSAFMVSATRADGFAVSGVTAKPETRKVAISDRENLPHPPPGAKFARRSDMQPGLRDNDFINAAPNPLSTFGIDVDAASYGAVRRAIEHGARPARDAVHIEEMLNYFPYHYAAPRNDPVAISLEVAEAPWAPKHRLVRIGIKAREVSTPERSAANLVFLLDVSSSMDQPNKLPLVKQSLRMLVGKLRPDDRVAIVTYAGNSGLVLASTPASRPREILNALDSLSPIGATNGNSGIELAYDIAKANFVSGGINRVILCTDGDDDVGVARKGELARLVEDKAGAGIFLSVLGFGVGNYRDGTLEKLASRGNGIYGYIDTFYDAERLFIQQVNSTFVPVAKDVKIQVDFNAAQVASYRLIGYENRLLRKEDFSDDSVESGQMGAGQTVTALYEIVPAGSDDKVLADTAAIFTSKYAPQIAMNSRLDSSGGGREPGRNELLTVFVRYKKPEGFLNWLRPQTLEFPLVDAGASFSQASADFRFVAAVAQFGMMLRGSPYRGSATLGDIVAWAASAAAKPGDDPGGYRGEFIDLVRKAQTTLE